MADSRERGDMLGINAVVPRMGTGSRNPAGHITWRDWGHTHFMGSDFASLRTLGWWNQTVDNQLKEKEAPVIVGWNGMNTQARAEYVTQALRPSWSISRCAAYDAAVAAGTVAVAPPAPALHHAQWTGMRFLELCREAYGRQGF
ncbi:hypothetical protein DFJ77DRAFT_512899 [Powellomyces hirtus]|nr:hypothetical protein DFJ77DRAFT_512899 [Powellomyces hirtus]